jgi:hypothetical protein
MNAPQAAAAAKIAAAAAAKIAEKEATSLFDKFSAITGSVPDIIAAVDVVRGWLQAQDGLTYEAHTFAVSGPTDKEDDGKANRPAPSGARNNKSGRSNEALRPAGIKPISKRSEVDKIPIAPPTQRFVAPPKQRIASTKGGLPVATTPSEARSLVTQAPEVKGELDYPMLTLTTTSVNPVDLLDYVVPGLGLGLGAARAVIPLIGSPVLNQLNSYLGTQNVAAFGLTFRRTGPRSFLCTTSLTEHIGFDTALGSQAGCSFGGQDQQVSDAGSWHLLSFNGWINKAGPGVTSPGFVRFGGCVRVGVDWAGALALIPHTCAVVSPSGVGTKNLGWSERQGYVVEI